jgi:hypothetical protein
MSVQVRLHSWNQVINKTLMGLNEIHVTKMIDDPNKAL